ncbi:MAG: hypothetical protein ABIS69_09100 [Sediminibacterium sp.]
MATRNLSGAVILKKNKDYSSVQDAQMFYEKFRLTELATILFPTSEYPKGFKEYIISLMKFQNPVQMQVWHNKNKGIKDEKGNRVTTTWENMCYFNRPFTCAEIYQCLEILKRVTPNEISEKSERYIEFIKNSKERNESLDFYLLSFFNEILYPEIELMVNKIQAILDDIEEQVCKPKRDKINADLKIMMQLSVGENVEFIKAKERKL